MARIQLKFRDKIVKDFPLVKPFTTIGRTEENDIIIDNLGASRLHAQIIQDEKGFWIEDMDSANGTLLNNQPVKKQLLKDLDEIEIGKHKLIFLLHSEVSPEEVAALSEGKKSSSSHNIMMAQEETVHADGSDIKTKGYRRLTPGGLKSEVKEAGVEILEGGVDQTIVKFSRLLIVAGKGPAADIRIKGNYDKDVLFVITKRPDGYFISPPKGGTLKVDGQDVHDYTRLINGSIIQAEQTKLKFFLVF